MTAAVPREFPGYFVCFCFWNIFLFAMVLRGQEMKLFYLAILINLCGACAAFADSFMGDEAGELVCLNANTIVGDDVNFMPGVVDVERSLLFENYGHVNSEFAVCSHCKFRIVNHGDFVANFSLADGAMIEQVVRDVDELNPIVSDTEYTLFVDGTDEISLNGVLGNSDIGTIVIRDSVVNINDTDFSGVAGIELRGDVVFMADDLSGLYDAVVINNVSGDGRVRFHSRAENPMYADVGYIDDGNLYVKRVRETDYVKVLKNDVGVFLNNLRISNPGDGLLRVLDSAVDMDALRDAMERSVRFNPDVLENVTKVINSFYRFGFENEIGIGAGVVAGENFYSYGVDVGATGNVGAVKVAANVRAGDIEYKSDVDKFTGAYFGLNLRAEYAMKNNLWIRGVADVARFDFDIGDVFYENHVVSNPSVVSINGAVDFGYWYVPVDSFYVMPFVGFDASNYKTDDMNNVGMCARGGVGAGYGYEMMGIKYNYDFVVGMDSENAMHGTGRIGFWSQYDMMGGDAKFSVVRMFDAMAYHVSIAGRVSF